MNLRCERIVNADTQSIRIANAGGQQNKKDELSVGKLGFFFRIVLCGKSGIGFAHPYAAAGILAHNKKEELSQVNLDFSSFLLCAERVGFKPTVR